MKDETSQECSYAGCGNTLRSIIFIFCQQYVIKLVKSQLIKKVSMIATSETSLIHFCWLPTHFDYDVPNMRILNVISKYLIGRFPGNWKVKYPLTNATLKKKLNSMRQFLTYDNSTPSIGMTLDFATLINSIITEKAKLRISFIPHEEQSSIWLRIHEKTLQVEQYLKMIWN